MSGFNCTEEDRERALPFIAEGTDKVAHLTDSTSLVAAFAAHRLNAVIPLTLQVDYMRCRYCLSEADPCAYPSEIQKMLRERIGELKGLLAAVESHTAWHARVGPLYERIKTSLNRS